MMKPSQNNFPHVRSVLYSTPWAITEAWLDDISAIFERHLAGQAIQPFAQKTKRGRRCPECKTGVLKAIKIQTEFGPRATGDYNCPACGCKCNEEQLPPYELINGTAILELSGPLFPRANLLTQLSGATSYDEYGSDFMHAMNNPEVASVFQIADSPGGSCLRLSETCSIIHAAREMGTKPIFGLIDPMACSAAYAIMSQCDRLFITESGMTGSIGVIMRYVNWDRAIANDGGDITQVTSSDVKSFGHPQSRAQYDSLIETMNSYFEQFKEIVARGRPEIDVEKVAGANVWIGQKAVSMGLVDGVSTMENVLAELSSGVVV